MIMVVSETDDWRVQEARMAKAKEHHERCSLIGQWCSIGHVKVIGDNDPVNIRLRIEDEFFADPRDRFPSVQLIAKLQLAIHAGRSCTKDNPFEPGIGNHGQRVPIRNFARDHIGDMLEHAYHNVAKLTAAVKKPAGRPRP